VEQLESRLVLAAVITATLTDNTAVPLAPGATIHYTEVISNTAAIGAGNEALNLQIAQALDPNTTLVPGSLNISPLAFDDTFSAVGNTQLFVNAGGTNPGGTPAATVALIGGIFANDIEFENDLDVLDTFTLASVQGVNFTGSPVTATTSGGGSVTVNADGTFSYTPAAGFTGADTFTYTITDDGVGGVNPLTGTGTVTINVANRVWYVNNSGANGDGRSHSPFNSLAAVSGATGPDLAGDIIFVHTGSGNYTGGITLLNNQTLWGENEALVVGGFTLRAAGADPVITNATGNGVTLASGNTLKGFTVGDTTTGDIVGTAVGSLTVSNLVANGTGPIFSVSTSGALNVTLDTASTTNSATTGISLTGVTGSFTATSGAISGVTGDDVFISGGTAAVNIGANITNTAGRSINIDNHETGNITFSGSLSDTGTGILVQNSNSGTIAFTNATKTLNTGSNAAVTLTSNAGATINFTGGGLDIDTTSGTGFSATGGGTVTVEGSGNSITTTTGTALNLSGVTIGASGVTLASVSTNGAANGILLATVGQAAGSTGIDILGGSIVNATTRGVDIDATSADVAITATISTTAAGRSVEVTNSGSAAAGGNQIVFSGAIDDNGLGINLDNNDAGNGATITFSGGLDIDSTTNTGFNAINGGTVNVTGSNNTIDTTTATALNVANTTIGASDLTFQRISSSGGTAAGIVLNTTGSSGGLHVTGTGSAGSGGTIANKTGGDIASGTAPGTWTGGTVGTAIILVNTADVQLDRMQLNDFTNYAIYATDVAGLSFTNSTISGTNGDSNAFDETSMFLRNCSGTITLTSVNISGGLETNLDILYDSATADTATYNVASSTFHDLGTGNNAQVKLTSTTAASSSSNVTFNFGSPTNAALGNTFDNSANQNPSPPPATQWFGDGILVTFEGPFQHTINIDNNTFFELFQAIDFAANFSADVDARIYNNTITFTEGVGAIAFGTGSSSTASMLFQMLIEDNDIGGLGNNSGSRLGSGIVGDFRGAETARVTIHQNVVQDTEVNPINIISQMTLGQDGDTHLRITNNTIASIDDDEGGGAGVIPGINVTTNAGTNGDIFLTISGNTSAGINEDGILVRQATVNNTFSLEDFAGNGTIAADVEAYLESLNSSTARVRTGGSVVNYSSMNLNNTNTPAPFSPLLFAPKVSDSAAPPVVEPAVAVPPVIDGEAGERVLPTMVVSPPVITEPVIDDGVLSQAELDSFVTASITRWSATGLTDDQIAVLHSVTFAVADMPGLYLGSFAPGLIKLDSDAAGRGWFLDATPLEDSEFIAGHAGSGTVAAGRLDQLTAILHEMGHALGLDDTYSFAGAGNVMYGFLTLGTRRLPAVGQAEGAVPHDEDSPDYVFSPITIGTLPPQKSVTIVFDATVNSPAAAGVNSVSKQGTVTGTGINLVTNDPDTAAPNDATVTQIDAAPDLQIVSLIDGQTSAAPGETVTYTINYNNIGNQGASNVSIDVTLPVGTTFNPGGSGGTWVDQGGGIFRQTIGTLAGGGASGSTTFSYTVNSPAPAGVESLVVTATIQDDNANGADPVDNDSKIDTNTLVASPDLAITKSDGGVTLQPGDTVIYVLNFSNLGNQNAAGVVLHETVPIGATFNAAASSVGWVLVTGTGSAGSTYNFAVGALAGGASGTAVNFAVTSDNPFAGSQISNTATIDYALTEDANATNNTATDTTPVISDDLVITKTDGVASEVPGTTVTYIITVSNASTSTQTATGALVNDTFPAILTGVTYTAAAAGGATGFTASGSGNIADTVNLPVGSSITYTVTGTIAASATGTLVNTATVTAPAGFVEGDTSNNTATDSDTLTPQAELSMTKSDSPDPVIAGTNVTYTLDFANSGPSDAQNVSITDALPAGTTFVSATAPAGWTAMTPAVGGTGNVVFTKSTAASGELASFTIVVNVNASAADGSIITNSAVAASDATDPTPGNNTGTTTTTVSALADLSVTKTDSPDPVNAGANLTYTVTVTNNGASDAQGVSLTDAVPANTTFVSAMQTSGPAFTLTTPPVGGTGSLSATVATLAAGASAAFTFVVNVDLATADATLLSNTATVTSTTTDPNSANNSDTETTAVQVVNLAVSKTDSPDPVVAGTNLTYTIMLTKTGSGTADNVSLSDVIPAGTTFVSASQTSGPAFTLLTPPVGGTGAFTATSAALAGGATATFTLVVNVNANTPGGSTLSNTVDVTTTSVEQTTADNSDTETTAVVTEADLSVEKTDAPDPVLAGANLTYTITVTNSGPSDAQSVSLSDLVPANTTFVSAMQTSGPAFTLTTPPVGGTGSVSATAATFSAGASATFTVVVNVNAVSSSATITNTATATSSTPDPDLANNSDTETTNLPISVVDGKLQIEGSSQDDIVTITGIPAGVAGSGMYLVTIQQGSGPVLTQTVSGVTGDICVFLHEGNDQLTMNNAYVAGSIIIEMDTGNDTVTLGHADVVSTQDDLIVDLGADNDTLNGRRIFIGGDQNLAGGDGNDTMTFDGFASPFTLGTSAAGNANWNTGGGNDTVNVVYAFIGGAWGIDLGAGTDSLNIFGSSASGNMSTVGAAGDDTFTVNTNFFDNGLFLDGGAENDTIFLANGLGTEMAAINSGAGSDTITVLNQTASLLVIDSGAGNDTAEVRSSAFDRFFAIMGDDDDQLTIFGNLFRFEMDLDGGNGLVDRLLNQGNDVRGAARARNFELFG
jgi:uncharacterized repeat protein (TIGR01451 family)